MCAVHSDQYGSQNVKQQVIHSWNSRGGNDDVDGRRGAKGMVVFWF